MINKNPTDLLIKKRNLPHWTIENSIYFVTFCTVNTLLSVDEQKLVLNHLIEGHNKYYSLTAAVVMPDHAHILIAPIKNYKLSRIMKGINGVSSRKINIQRKSKGVIWQDESYDRIIRNQKEFDEKLLYMFNNPIKKELTDDPWNYHGWFMNQEIDI